ncbi:hypothetical protein Tco_0496656 [Tanacetum coccineum]
MQGLLRAKFLPLTFKQDAYLDYQNSDKEKDPSVYRNLITGLNGCRLRCADECKIWLLRCQGLGHLKRDCPNKQLVAFVDDVEPKYDTENEDASVTLYTQIKQSLIVRKGINLCCPHPDNDTTWLAHNIFRYSKITPKGRVCTVIIDGGSCENMVAKTMVDKLGLPTTDHPDSYQLTWFRKGLPAHEGETSNIAIDFIPVLQFQTKPAISSMKPKEFAEYHRQVQELLDKGF